MATLNHLFNPESIAVVGATPKAGKVGNTLLKKRRCYT
ncbi:Acetate--CoA ligase [ADP-forming] I [ANME-1 cluster archaeon GoMg3.2]|nr:Acetate--CoA ligase [ADP-forming] I [ANME-1 cluster archaeon GoMg3.2]